MTRIGGVGNQSSYTGGKSPQAQAADDAERQVRQRMGELERMAKHQEAQGQDRVEEAHRQAEIQENRERVRHEAAIEDQKTQFLVQSRELQQSIQAELARIRREGETEVRKLDEYYKHTLNNLDREGEKKLAETTSQQQSELAYHKSKGEHELNTHQDQYREQLARFHDLRTQQSASMNQSALEEQSRMKTSYSLANEKSQEQFATRHSELVNSQNKTLDKIYRNANERLTDIRDYSAARLDAYQSRQSDPFYQMMRTDARVSDEGDHFVLEASIPPHERDHVSVSVKGSQIVLTGYRRNEEKLELGPGRSQGSASFQSYQETFPISWPVEARQMTRDYEGDRLIVRIPKKNEFASPPPKTKSPPALARAERPNFPENIPYTNPERQPSSSGKGAIEAPEPIRQSTISPGKLVLDSDVSGTPTKLK